MFLIIYIFSSNKKLNAHALMQKTQVRTHENLTTSSELSTEKRTTNFLAETGTKLSNKLVSTFLAHLGQKSVYQRIVFIVTRGIKEKCSIPHGWKAGLPLRV